MFKKVLICCTAVSMLGGSVWTMGYQEFLGGKGGWILDQIVSSEAVTQEQVSTLVGISESLSGGISTIRDALISKFPNGASETESITAAEQQIVDDLYGAMLELYRTVHP